MGRVWKFFNKLKFSAACNTCCCTYDTLKDEQSQVVKLPNGDMIVIYGYERSFKGSFGLAILSFFTLFIGLIIASVRPGGLTPWFYRRSALSSATKVMLTPKSFVNVQRDSDGRRWFIWLHYRFIWCAQSGKFKRMRCVDEIGLRFSDIHGLGNGLDPTNHRLRKESYGSNTTEVAYPSLISLLISTSMKPFRLFYLVAIATWIVQKYYIYAGLIGLAAVVEAGSSVFLQFRHRLRFHRLSLLNCEITVLGPGHDRRLIMSHDLVPGSVIQLTSKGNITMPCDAVILSGSCIARESVAANPKHKYQLPKSRMELYDRQKHRQHTLFRGSSIVLQTEKVIALVIRTGWSTENGGAFAAKMASISCPSIFDRHRDHLFLLLGLTGLCSAAYGIYVRHSSLDIPNLILTGMSLIVICLPPLFSPALLLTSLYPLVRLYQDGFRFNSFDEPSSVLNRVGATDTVCLLENALLRDAATKLLKVSSTRYDEWTRDPQLTLCMASCVNHFTPNDFQVFSTAAWKIITNQNSHRVQSVCNEYESYRVTKIYADETHSSLPFVLVRADPIESVNATSWYFIRGPYLRVVDFAEEYSFEHKEEQLELVAFAGRQLTETEKLSTLEPDLSLLLRKFQLLGLASVDCNISKDSSAVVSLLRSANIRTLMISKRDVREAVHLARNAGIILNKEPVAQIEIPSMEGLYPPSLRVIDLPETGSGIDLEENSIPRKAHVVLTGDMLDALLESFPEMVDQIIGRVTVFASTDTLQTNRFLEKLNGLNRKMLVCKDAEDCYLTVPVNCLTLAPQDEHQILHRDLCNSQSISSIRELLGQSRASLVGSLGISKLMVCYMAARLTSTLLLYDNPSPAIQTLFVDLVLVMAPTMLFGFTQPNNHSLSKKRPSQSIIRLKEILSVFFQLALVVATQYFALIMAQHQPWFERTLLKTNWTDDSFTLSDENYAVYSLSLFQYLNLFVVFSSGAPHLRRIWSNLGLTLYLLTLAIFCSVVVLEPPEQLKIFMALKTPPVFDFRLALFSLAVIYIFTSLGIQCLIDYCFVPVCFSRASPRNLSDLEGLDSASVNVLYRPSTLTTQTHQLASEKLSRPTTLNLPIF